MRRLNVIRILEYYDVPQLFVAEDAVGIRYLCLHYEIDNEGNLLYCGIQVSQRKLNDFIKGHIDLLSMFQNPEQDNSRFTISISGDTISAEEYKDEFLPQMLPLSGYFYDDTLNEDEEMVARSVTMNRPIIRLAFDTPDNRHDIDSRCLSAALVSFQSLIESSFKKLFKDDDSSASSLRVIAFMPASFDVEFYANEELDMFGQSKLSVTFDSINQLFSDQNDTVVDTLRMFKGFAASSYKKFLDVMLDYGVSLKYKWVFSTLESEVHKNEISLERIKTLHSIITAYSDLGTEEQIFEGSFLAASTGNGRWTFQVDSGKTIKGECDNPALLNGVTLTDKSYSIVCQVEQTINDTTLKEKTKYKLESISPFE